MTSRDEFPVRWDPHLVFQGFLNPSELADLIDADGGAWSFADPGACELNGHQPRLHPCGDGSFYCTRCGAEDVDEPEWMTQTLKEIRDAQ